MGGKFPHSVDTNSNKKARRDPRSDSSAANLSPGKSEPQIRPFGARETCELPAAAGWSSAVGSGRLWQALEGSDRLWEAREGS